MDYDANVFFLYFTTRVLAGLARADLLGWAMGVFLALYTLPL